MVRLGLWQKKLHSRVATVSLFTVTVLAQMSNWSRDRVLLPSMHTLQGGKHRRLLHWSPSLSPPSNLRGTERHGLREDVNATDGWTNALGTYGNTGGSKMDLMPPA